MRHRAVLRATAVSTKNMLRRLWRTVRRPDRLTYFGVEIDLTGEWATSFIRDSFYAGWYERGEAEIVEATLRAEDRYLELGAGMGFLSCIACRVVGDERVTVVEANPRLAPAIRATAAANGFSPEVMTAVGVRHGEPLGSRPFHVSPDFWTSRLEPMDGAEVVEVPAVDLDALLTERGTTYLNVDIEGGEIGLLAADVPAGVRAICLETHPDVTGDAAITGMLRRLFDQGFVLQVELNRGPVLFLRRERE